MIALFNPRAQASPAPSAQYAIKSVRFILPFPPGGGTDSLARAVGNRLSEALGQKVMMGPWRGQRRFLVRIVRLGAEAE